MTHHTSPLRIALAVSSLARAGAEKQCVYIARALAEAGVDLRVFYFGSGGYYEQVLRGMNIPVSQVYWPGKRLKILWRLVRGQFVFRPHIVMTIELGDAIHAGIAGRLCGAMTIAGVRSDGLWETQTYGHRSWWMRHLPNALIANSFRGQQTMIALGVRPEMLEVLPNVIDLTDFDERSRRPLPEIVPGNRIVVAGIGRLHYTYKRFDRMIAALALARKKEPALLGLLVGKDQGARARLEEQAKALGLSPGHLVILGESEQVPALLQRAHMLVLSSDYEGFPNVILEAMAARLPVIATPAGDAARLVEHEHTGYVVDYEDIQSMAACMVRLAQSPSLRTQFGQAARHRVEKEYVFERLSGRLFTIFQRLAERQRRPRLLQILPQGRFAMAQ